VEGNLLVEPNFIVKKGSSQGSRSLNLLALLGRPAGGRVISFRLFAFVHRSASSGGTRSLHDEAGPGGDARGAGRSSGRSCRRGSGDALEGGDLLSGILFSSTSLSASQKLGVGDGHPSHDICKVKIKRKLIATIKTTEKIRTTNHKPPSANPGSGGIGSTTAGGSCRVGS